MSASPWTPPFARKRLRPRRLGIRGDTRSERRVHGRVDDPLQRSGHHGAFHTNGTAGALSASLSGLHPGPNVLEVFNAQVGAVTKYAQQTITRSVPVAAPCASLASLDIPASAIGLPTSGVTITSARIIPAIPQSVSGSTVTLATPQFCQVLGAILPVDQTAPNINFQVNIPDNWNQKIAQLGGSGNNGVIPGALTGNGMRSARSPSRPIRLTL